MSSELHCALNLPSPLRPTLGITDFPKVRRTELVIQEHINEDIIDVLAKRNITVILAELFYSVPHITSVIHSDTFGNDISKINWIYGGKGSKMNWYHVNQENNLISGSSRNTYKMYQENEVSLIHSTELCSPSLIQAAVPHNIINGAEERWAVSLMLRDNSTYRQLAFHRAVEHLRDFRIQ